MSQKGFILTTLTIILFTLFSVFGSITLLLPDQFNPVTLIRQNLDLSGLNSPPPVPVGGQNSQKGNQVLGATARYEPTIYVSINENDYGGSGGVLALSSEEEPVIYITSYSNENNVNAGVEIYEANEDTLVNYLVHDAEGKQLNKTVDVSSLKLVGTLTHNLSDKSLLLPVTGTGIWTVRINIGGKFRDSIVVRSSTGVYTTQGDEKFIFWGQNFRSGRSVNSGTVRVFNLLNSKKELKSVRVDSQGTAETPFDQNADVALFSNGTDFALIPLNLKYLNYGSSDYFMFRSLKDDQQYFIFTDRPIYKPGDTVYYKAIVRDDYDARYGVPKGKYKAWIVKDWDWEHPLSENIRDITENGTIDGEFVIPADSSAGYFTLYVDTDGVKPDEYGYYRGTSSISFEVEHYRKPEYELSADADKKEVTSDGSITFNLEGKYFSGHPFSQQVVKYKIYSSDYYQYEFNSAQQMADLDDGEYTPYQSGIIREGEVKLDRQGKGSVKVSARVPEGKLNNQVFTIEATTNDASLNPSFARSNVIVYSGNFEIFRKDFNTYAKVGTKARLPLYLEGRNGETVSSKSLKATGRREWWVPHQTADLKYPEYTKQTEELPQMQIVSGAQGEAVFEFTPHAAGTYIYIVSGEDSKGNSISRQFYIYATDENINYFERKDSGFNLFVDKALYQPDEKVVLSINSDSADRDLFLTLERGFVSRYQVVKMQGKTASVEIPLQKDDIPNVYAQVSTFTRSNYAGDAKNISVSTDSKKLDVQITPDHEKYGPGDTVTVNIETKNVDGAPVPAEVTLWAVDKAIFELSESTLGNIFNTFWAERYHNTQAAHSLEGISVMQMGGGGGCFTSDTKILMPGNTQKPIKDIRPGDVILTWNSNRTSLVEAKVTGTHDLEVNGYLIINGDLKVTENHKIWVNDGFKEAGSIQKGDILLGSDGKKVAVTSIEWQLGKTRVYNLEVEKFHTFIADGVYVHNQKGSPRAFFKDTAYWNPSVTTDSSGKAKVTFKLPDNITTWVLASVGSNQQTQVGQNTKEILVTKDVIVRPILPNLIRTSDKLVVSSLVHNFTDKTSRFNLKAAFDTGEIFSQGQTTVDIGSKETFQSYWGIIPSKETDKAKLSFEAKANDQFQDSIIAELPVREYGFFDKNVQNGTGDKDFSLKLNPQINTGKSKITLTLAPSLLSSAVSSFEYLLYYPYGCVEQTTSRLIPALIARSNPALVKDLPNKPDLDGIITKGVKRLEELNRGGWSWWEHSDTDSFVTVYVLESLLEAKRLGYPVSEQLIKNPEGYLGNTYFYDSKSGQSLPISPEEQAIREYGLSLIGAKKSDDRSQIFNNSLSTDVLALRVLTNINNGDNDSKTNGLDELIQRAKTDGDGIYFDEGPKTRFGSVNASTALALRAMIKGKADKELITKAVRYLSTKRQYDYWSNTFATSQVIKALILAGESTGELTPNYSYQVLLDGKEISRGKFTDLESPKVIEINPKDIGQNGSTVSIKKNGTGEMYSTLIVNELNTNTSTGPKDQGLSVTRKYVQEDDPDSPLEIGDIIKVTFSVNNPSPDNYFAVIEDQLPSGMVPINPNLNNEQFFDTGYVWDGVEKEVTENGMILSPYRISKGINEFTYKARVVAEGESIAPPATVALMYSPEIYGKTGSEVIRTQRQIEPTLLQKLTQEIKQILSFKFITLILAAIGVIAIILVGSFLLVRKSKRFLPWKKSKTEKPTETPQQREEQNIPS